jgi:MFS family permease
MRAPTDRPVVRLLASHALAATAMSLPWPWLLVLVWDETHDPTLLGVAAAARMVPYVVCSWWAARLGDRHRRDVVVRATIWARLLLLGAVAVATGLDRPFVAVALAALAVAVATPAYPALAAAMPEAAKGDADRATQLLVTIEVASFVVGPAIGGLLLAVPGAIAPLSVVATACALALLAGVRLSPAARRTTESGGTWSALRRSAPIRRALVLMAVLNLVDASVGVTLLLLARGDWTGWWTSGTAYGVASGALGFGALAAPVLARCGSGLAGRSRWGVLLMAVGVLTAAVSPSVGWALVPLLLAGAAAVHAESAATGVVQVEGPDDVRASLFGVADACMVAAALVGALVAPTLADRLGPETVLVVLGLVAVASALVVQGTESQTQARPSTTVPSTSSSVSTDVESPTEIRSSDVRSA